MTALPAKIDAVAYGLSLIHEDTRAIREDVRAFRDSAESRFDRQGEMLEEILRRLPPGATP